MKLQKRNCYPPRRMNWVHKQINLEYPVLHPHPKASYCYQFCVLMRDSILRHRLSRRAMSPTIIAFQYLALVEWVSIGLILPWLIRFFDPLKPEVVLYATGSGGNLRLVAVEYIVINVGQPAPMFGDQPFNVGGTPVPVPHWSLHVWLYENNPSGIFVPFNPNISCQ